MATQLRQALRLFLLPIRDGREKRCVICLKAVLREHRIKLPDVLTWATHERELWRDTGRPSPVLLQAFSRILNAADDRFGALVGAAYFKLHDRLGREHLLSHDQAIAFLSHSFLMCDLASVEGSSAAQIARLLGQRDRRVNFSRPSIATALESFRMLPEVSKLDVERLFSRDRREELPKLADADAAVAAEMVGRQGEGLGFIGDLGTLLQRLAPVPEMGKYAPYLQILHFQCCIAEYFDHAVTDLYEFSPRGNAVTWLISQYPPVLSPAGNPFLNNAKSVERLTDQWVRSKKLGERPGAHALFSILSGMDEMGFAARREIAGWIRLWLHRIIRISIPTSTVLPPQLSDQQFLRIVDATISENTRTFGILEQRVVDLVGLLTHGIPQWRSRGLGDSVNATNISGRKLGDCDFQDSASYRIEAYEAHGGELTDVYASEHVRTLGKCIAKRLEELKGVADIESWSASVTFVAHRISANFPQNLVIHGLRVELLATTFDEFLRRVPIVELRSAANQHLLVRLGDSRTPEEVRVSVHRIISQ
jgi:hypothetical protein